MKPKTYRSEIRLRESLDAFDLAERWDKARGVYSQELIDEALSFVVRCFGGQFTAEELLDGYEGSAFALIPNFLRAVIGYVAEEMADFPPRAATETMKRTG